MNEFPILRQYQREYRKLYSDARRSVPWAWVALHEEQAKQNHAQTLQRLAERGGLDPGELWAVVHRKRWREAPTPAVAEAWLADWDGTAP